MQRGYRPGMRSLHLGSVLGGTALLASLLAVVPGPTAAEPAEPASASAERSARAAYPALAVRRLVTGLDHPWDVRPLGDGRLIFTQRDRRTLRVWANGRTHGVSFPRSTVWANSETGLSSVAVDPDFAENRRIYLCHGGFRSDGRRDVRVDAWRLNPAATRATRIRLLVGGFPVTTGRHGGCRLMIDRVGSLFVGTGDAVIGTTPQNLRSFGGKTLRLNRFTGAPWPSNPFPNAKSRTKRYVFTYGHRNVQGLSQRRNGTLWSVEQGTDRDDEVNRLVRGGNYGWDPKPGYQEYSPMTDQSLPGAQRGAVWRSGAPTIATSGGSFIYGAGSGSYHGTLAVAALKGQRVIFLTLSAKGRLVRVRVPDELRHYGRLRTVVDGPGGSFYVTTDNGGGRDSILWVRPRG